MAYSQRFSAGRLRVQVQQGIDKEETGNLIDEATARCMAEHGAYLVLTLSTYAAIAREGKRIGWSEAMLNKASRVKNVGVEAMKFAMPWLEDRTRFRPAR